MSDTVCLLVTVLYRSGLLRCAIEIPLIRFASLDELQSPMNDVTRGKIHAMLPPNVRNCGPIVAIEEIFEIHVVPR